MVYDLSLLLVVLIVAPVIMLWAFHIPYNTFFSIIPRSTVTIITLFTCCVFVFFAFSIRFLAYRIQFHLINRAIRKYDSEIQTLLRIMQDDSELKVEKLSRRSREFIEEYYGNHSLSNPPSKNVVIKNLILDRLSDFMMTFGDVVH